MKHEEAVVEKRTEVTGAVRARKKVDSVKETVKDTVRKEDVQVDRRGTERDRP